MASTVVRKIVGEIVVKDNKATQKLKKFDGSLTKADRSMGRAGRSAGKLSRANRGIATSATKATKATKGLSTGVKGLVGLVGIGAFVAIGRDLLQVSSDFAEAQDKFDVVFGGKGSALVKEASAAIKDLGKNYGFSNKESTELLANTADILTGFGTTKKAAFDMSLEVQQLASGLASFNNIPVAQASRAITSGLLGEREAMKSLGIVVREEDVKQRLFAKGMKNLKGEALLIAKAQITLEIATQQSGNAIDNFRLTMNSNANQAKILKNDMENLKIEIGAKLLPVQLKITKAFIKFLPMIKKPIVFIPILITAFILLTAALWAVLSSLIAILSPFLLIIGIILAVSIAIAALVQWWDVVVAFFNEWKGVMALMLIPILPLIISIRLIISLFKVLIKTVGPPLIAMFKKIWGWVKLIAKPFMAIVGGLNKLGKLALGKVFGNQKASQEKAVKTAGGVNIKDKPSKTVNDAFISKDGNVTAISDDDNISVSKGGGGMGTNITNLIGQLTIHASGEKGAVESMKEAVMNALNELATEIEMDSGVV